MTEAAALRLRWERQGALAEARAAAQAAAGAAAVAAARAVGAVWVSAARRVLKRAERVVVAGVMSHAHDSFNALQQQQRALSSAQSDEAETRETEGANDSAWKLTIKNSRSILFCGDGDFADNVHGEDFGNDDEDDAQVGLISDGICGAINDLDLVNYSEANFGADNGAFFVDPAADAAHLPTVHGFPSPANILPLLGVSLRLIPLHSYGDIQARCHRYTAVVLPQARYAHALAQSDVVVTTGHSQGCVVAAQVVATLIKDKYVLNQIIDRQMRECIIMFRSLSFEM